MNTAYMPHPSDFDRLDATAAITPNYNPTHNQRTPEWYAARRGRFTGSEVWKLMVDPRTKSEPISQTALTYIREKVAELITGITPEASSAATEWGTANEPAAIALYAEREGVEITPADFVPFSTWGGGSPDGYIDPYAIIEVKCPYNSAVHLDNLLFARQGASVEMFKSQYREYYWQCQNNMLATGRPEAIFISYDPRFPDHQKLASWRVPYVPEDAQELVSRIAKAAALAEQMRKELGI